MINIKSVKEDMRMRRIEGWSGLEMTGFHLSHEPQGIFNVTTASDSHFEGLNIFLRVAVPLWRVKVIRWLYRLSRAWNAVTMLNCFCYHSFSLQGISFYFFVIGRGWLESGQVLVIWRTESKSQAGENKCAIWVIYVPKLPSFTTTRYENPLTH